MAGDNEFTRLAIVDQQRCKPETCGLMCKKSCPLNANNKRCITVKRESKANISEIICTGCGICINRCPYHAIRIIRLPRNIDKFTSHRYGPNMFKLHRLPVPRLGQVLGLLGANGIGKSTALNIISGREKPNLGDIANPPSWEAIIQHYRGHELQSFFRKIVEQDLTVSLKAQYVENLVRDPAFAKLRVGRAIQNAYDRGDGTPDGLLAKDLVRRLELAPVITRRIPELSGGELQRFSIAVAAARAADMYLIDEPSSYLDIRQRLTAGALIRDLAKTNAYVVCVEHDLAVLDYISDFVCILFGEPGVYGVISTPYTVRAGINIYLSGFIPSENMRFRPEPLTFRMATTADNGNVGAAADEIDESVKVHYWSYPSLTKTFYDKDGAKPVFRLNVEAGTFQTNQITVLVGENGTGKTTLVKILGGKLSPDDPSCLDNFPRLQVSYKPQNIRVTSEETVLAHLMQKLKGVIGQPLFKAEVLDKLGIDMSGEHNRLQKHNISDQKVINLSGGERQRVALAQSLGQPCDLHLIDEPSAYLDVEQRVIVAKMIKRWIMAMHRCGFVVEHDFLMATYLADRVIVYEGTPAVEATAKAPEGILEGFNRFLKSIEVTFRRDPENFRPRVNKLGSAKDCEQKSTGNYFFTEVQVADMARDEDEE